MNPETVALEFARWLDTSEFSEGTKEMYALRVRQYTAWLAPRVDVHPDALTSPQGRDKAVGAYREHLLVTERKALATVEAGLSALTKFYGWLGFDKPVVERVTVPKGGFRELKIPTLRLVMTAAQARGARDYALTRLLFGSAVTVSEAAGLDTDDVTIHEHSGYVRVGGRKARTVPINKDVRDALRPLLGQPGPLFVSNRGTRLSVRRIQAVMNDLGDTVGVKITPHLMRHSFAQAFLNAGGDPAELQRLLGFRHLESTDVYTVTPDARLADLMERVTA